LAASMVKVMDPFRFSGSFYLKNNGLTHKHLMGPSLCNWQLPQKLWAHPNSAAAIIIKTMGPFNNQYYC
jgi:hypothetical protein